MVFYVLQVLIKHFQDMCGIVYTPTGALEQLLILASKYMCIYIHDMLHGLLPATFTNRPAGSAGGTASQLAPIILVPRMGRHQLCKTVASWANVAA